MGKFTIDQGRQFENYGIPSCYRFTSKWLLLCVCSAKVLMYDTNTLKMKKQFTRFKDIAYAGWCVGFEFPQRAKFPHVLFWVTCQSRHEDWEQRRVLA